MDIRTVNRFQDSNGVIWEISVNTDGTLQTTAVTGTVPPSPPPIGTYLGLTKAQIIDMVRARTENRTSEDLLKMEYVNALREVAQEHRFYWRKRKATIQTIPSFGSYELNAYISDPGEILGVYYVKSDGTTEKLHPIHLTDEVEENEESTTQGEPKLYSLNESYATLKLFPIPNAVYSIKVVYRAVPNVSIDDLSDQIPLIPPAYHPLVEKCIEKNVLEFLFGPESPRYATASAQYAKLLDKAIKESKDFAVNIRRYEEPDEREQDAIRSTY